MAARIIDGRAVAADVTARVAEHARLLKAETGIVPGLAVVLVGNDPASEIYVSSKGKKAEELGFRSVQHTLAAETSEAALLALLATVNRDPAVHGVLVQFPVPSQIDRVKVVEAIAPEKDVDGLNPINVGRLAGALPGGLVPCTPAGCLLLIQRALPEGLAGKHAVVVGRSALVGRPMAQLLLDANCTVTVAHSRTRDLSAVVREGDIVVAAAGKAEMIRGNWIKPGAVVIDVGTTRVPAPERGPGKTRLVGDVAFAEAAEVAGAITPVPGGVGPMTIAMLMANTLTAAFRSVGRHAPKLA
ncbi:MAG TPA: bifunctional methylenetetrahydrofolate dehydrogenase/methenyltetrahydrofolate cyclohydrolase FolD [Bauldia sp.]|nr:bifunctional methylenetetrahydrofolate dehydrogenase/methenyltetrahydrofolate cyclohydrolase FolD [Bauldia sp.]